MRKSFYLSSLLALCFVLFSGAARATTDPVVSTDPVNDTVYAAGDSAHFNIEAHTGTADPLTYVWQVSTDAGATWNDVTGSTTIVSGDTTSSLAFPTTLAMNNYRYRCIASTTTSSDTSAAARLVIGLPPTITANPVNDTAYVTFPASFSANAIDTPVLEAMTFQWQVANDSLGPWTDILVGSISTTYSITATTMAMDGTWYRMVATSAAGSTPSAAARLSVSAGLPPVIGTNPVNDTAYVTFPAHFTATATDTPSFETMSFQWQVAGDTLGPWTDILATIGGTSSTFSITATTMGMNGTWYRVIASNTAGSDTSAAAILVVSAGLPPVIHPEAANDTVFAGFPATFSIGATDTPSFETMTYEWLLSTDGGSSWSTISTGTGGSSSVYIPVTSLSMDGYMYRAIVSNTAGSDTSTATLTVLAGHPPVITTNPHDTAVCETGHPYFSVAANDTPGSLTIHYTWFSSPDGGTTWDTVHNVTGQFEGATTDTLKLFPGALHTRSGYMYYAAVGSDSGLVFSTAATLYVDSASAGTISGLNEICRGSVTTLVSTIPGGFWTNINHMIDTVDSFGGNVYGVGPGIDTILYTDSNLCGFNTSRFVMKIDTVLTALPIEGPSATCIGHFVDFTDPAPGGTWSAASTPVFSFDTATARVIGLTTGSAAITYTLSNVCNTDYATYWIRVDGPLDAGTVTGDSLLCAGSWVHLTSTSSSEGLWLSSNSDVAVTDFDGNVTGVSNGTAIISYYLSNACGVAAATHIVTVAAAASMIVGLDSVGIGFTRTYLDSVAGGSWSISDTNIAIINSATGTVTGRDTGTVTITYTVTNFCGTSSSSLLINVGAIYAGRILGADSVCVGNSITMSDTVAGGVWSTASDTVITIDASSGVVTGIAGGKAYITYTYTNGFGTKSIRDSVFVKHIAVDSMHVPNIFSLGGSYTLVGYPAGGTWTTTNTDVGNFIGSPGFFVIYGTGSDTVIYTVTNSCGTARDSVFINVPFASGVNQVPTSVSVMNVYPNPSEGDFTINIASNVSEDATVTVTNMVGEKVKEITIRTNESNELKLDQPDGVYFINATTSTGKYSAKITITK